MLNLDQFIAENVIMRKKSMFLEDIEANSIEISQKIGAFL